MAEILGQASFLDDVPVRKGEHLVPEAADVERCRSCNAPVVWIRTRSGATMPLSLATVVWRGGQRYALAHFADCPDSKEWSTR